MTREGYKGAKAYLEEINMYDMFMSNKTSTDGSSLIAFARHEILCGDCGCSIGSLCKTAPSNKSLLIKGN